MVSKTRWFCGLLLVAAVLVLLLSCGEPGGPISGGPGKEIDFAHYAVLCSQVEDLRAEGHDVTDLDAIVADVDRWIEKGEMAEAKLGIEELEAALNNLEQAVLPTQPPGSALPPAPAYSPVPQTGDTVLFEEDFSGEGVLAAWQTAFLDHDPGNMATWQQRQEALFLNMGGGGMEFAGMVIVTGEEWSDFVYSVDIFSEGNLQIGVVFRYQEDSFYRFRFLSHEYKTEWIRLLERVIGDEVVILDHTGEPGYQLGQWYNVQIVADGPQLSVYLNGELVLEATDDALSQGKVGAYTLSLGGVYFDNVRVTSIR